MNLLPPGQDVPPGQKATDVISKTLASIPPGKLEDVLTGMKVCSLASVCVACADEVLDAGANESGTGEDGA
jgi:hypothetical protein